MGCALNVSLFILSTLMLWVSDIRALLRSEETQQKYADNHNIHRLSLVKAA